MGNDYTKNNSKTVYTVDEISDILGICRNSAYKLIHSNEFEILKIGRLIRVHKESFDNWLMKNKQY